MSPTLSTKLPPLSHHHNIASLCPFYKYFNRMCWWTHSTCAPLMYILLTNSQQQKPTSSLLKSLGARKLSTLIVSYLGLLDFEIISRFPASLTVLTRWSLNVMWIDILLLNSLLDTIPNSSPLCCEPNFDVDYFLGKIKFVSSQDVIMVLCFLNFCGIPHLQKQGKILNMYNHSGGGGCLVNILVWHIMLVNK